MSVYLVTWDLNRERQNYAQARQNLITHLSKYDHIRDAGLDSVWFISSNGTADGLSSDIQTHLDDNDRLVVTKMVVGQQQGWLAQNVWEWISARL